MRCVMAGRWGPMRGAWAMTVQSTLAGGAHAAGGFLQQGVRIGPGKGGVRVGKVRANVAQARRAEHGISNGVQQRVSI